MFIPQLLTARRYIQLEDLWIQIYGISLSTVKLKVGCLRQEIWTVVFFFDKSSLILFFISLFPLSSLVLSLL